MPTRRSLLASAVAASLLPSTARATPSAKHLVWVLAYGGWDTSYALDPKPQRVVTNTGRVVEIDGIDFWSEDGRPEVDTFFERTRGATRIVRGVDVGSVSHGVCLRNVLTGSERRESPDIATRIAAGVAGDLPLPCLNMGTVGQAGALAPMVGRAGQSNQLRGLLDPEAALGPRPPSFDGEQAAAIAALVARRAEASGVSADRVADFLEAGWRAEAMKLRAGALGDVRRGMTWTERSDQAAQALRLGLSGVVLMDAGLDFDTHQGNAAQGPLHQQLFAQLHILLDALEGRGPSGGRDLLADTIVVVVSEMDRSPLLNAAGGKDHWPVATYLMVGGPLSGSRVVGATDFDGFPEPVDLYTGGFGGTRLVPASVLGALMGLFGLDHPYDDEALHALI